MSNVATSAPIGADSPLSIPKMERQQSLLFPSLFKKLDTSGRLKVLDIGPAHNETIHFFSQVRCRLHFAGMYTEPLTLEGRGDKSRDDLVEEFTRLLAVPEGTKFDLCLFWDYPNYLDDESLQAFDEALRPYLHAGTMAHAFAVRTSNITLTNQWYGIDQPHLFTRRPPRVRQPAFYPHSQAILINLLTGFSIERGMLLPDGRLEVAMRATVDEQSHD